MNQDLVFCATSDDQTAAVRAEGAALRGTLTLAEFADLAAALTRRPVQWLSRRMAWPG